MDVIGDSDDAGNAAVPVLDMAGGHGVPDEAENPPPETVEATDGTDATSPPPKKYDWSRLPVNILKTMVGRRQNRRRRGV